MWESWFARLPKSGGDIVSHSWSFLLKGKVLVQSFSKRRVKIYPGWNKHLMFDLNFLSLSFFFFFFGHPTTYGVPGPGIRSKLQCDPCWSCGNAGSLSHCAELGIKHASQHSTDTADPIAPQQELPDFSLKKKWNQLWWSWTDSSDFMCKPKFCSTQQALESPGNCLMKSPSNCFSLII